MLFTIAVNGIAQNLVPNPSFEDTVSCPFSSGEMVKATGWTSFCGTPDYFNSCNQFDWGVPNNIFGYQQAATGDAYAGFATYSSDSPDSREFPVCIFSVPLNIGTKYYVSFKVALSLNSLSLTNYASNNIGAAVTTGGYTCNSIITNNPPVFNSSIITDSLNWTTISGSFVADSAYTHLSIGNFFDDANTDTLKFFNDFSDNAYYYLDDVCVSTDSLTCNQSVGINETFLKQPFNIFPNPVTDYIRIDYVLYNKPYDIAIYSVTGQLLFEEKNVANQNKKIGTAQFGNGLLLIRIKSNNQTFTYKLIKN